MILLDTHVVIWLADRQPKLGAVARGMIHEAIERGEACLSVMSLMEVAALRRRGRITIGSPLLSWLGTIGEGLRVVPVDLATAIDSGSLDMDHGDPIDRTIMATARMRHCPLMTADRAILGHAAAGHLQAIDARL